MSIKRMFPLIITVWVVLWVHFLVRGLVRGKFYEYRRLMGRSLEEKRAIVFGDEFYEFVRFCKDRLPEGSTYRMVGRKFNDLDAGVMRYFLYPVMLSETRPDYIICYELEYSERGYVLYAPFAPNKYILKKWDDK